MPTSIDKLKQVCREATAQVWEHDVNEYEGDPEKYHCIIGPMHAHEGWVWFEEADVRFMSTFCPGVVGELLEWADDARADMLDEEHSAKAQLRLVARLDALLARMEVGPVTPENDNAE